MYRKNVVWLLGQLILFLPSIQMSVKKTNTLETGNSLLNGTQTTFIINVFHALKGGTERICYSYTSIFQTDATMMSLNLQPISGKRFLEEYVSRIVLHKRVDFCI